MRYSDRELEQADDFLGLDPDEQQRIYGKQQVHKKDELKPCPFCGGINLGASGTTDSLLIICQNCLSSSPSENWNTRTEPKEQDVCQTCKGHKVVHTPPEGIFPCPDCTGKAPVDKIREAFENIDISKDDPVLAWAQEYFTTSVDVNKHILACGFYKGYKSQQAEIEQLNKVILEYQSHDE